MKSVRKHSQFEAFLNNIPETWCYDRMKAVVSLRNLKTKEKSPKKDYLELEDIESGTGKLISKRESLNVDSSVTIFRKEDVLFGKLRPYLEKYYRANFDGKCTGEILAFSPENIESSFLLYCVASFWFIEQCNALSYGTKMPRVNWKKQLAYFNIPLPPSHEQKLIAAYLDTECSKIDDVIEIKKKQLDTLVLMRKSIINKAVTSGIKATEKMKDTGIIWMGKIPESWKVEKLKYITDLIVDGTHYTPTYIEEGIPFLRVTDIQESKINLDTVKYISKEEHETLCKRAKAEIFDILLSKNGTIGIVKVIDWNWEFSFFVSLCLIRPRKSLNPYYFSYYFESDIVEQQLFESSKRTSVTNLHLVKIRELKICLPHPKVQQKIVEYLNIKTKEIKILKENISLQITALENYRKSLIHECVTGKRRITKEVLAEVQTNV